MMNLFNLFATRSLCSSTPSKSHATSPGIARHLGVALMICAVLTGPLSASAATIWSEDFASYAAGTGIDSTGDIGDYPVSKWWLDVSAATFGNTADWLKTMNGLMEARDTDGVAVWNSESIDISGHTSVSISLDASESGTMEAADIVDSYYRIDGGSETLIQSSSDDFTSATHIANNIGGTGTGLIVVVKMNCNAGTEYMRFDNVVVTGTVSASCTEHWTSLYDRGTPRATYTLGDTLTNIWEFAINTDTSGWTVQWGYGKTTDGSSWTWETAAWSYYSDPNRVWKSSTTNQPTLDSTGSWYYAGRLTTGSCDYYADVDWEANSAGALSAASYFTVSALNNPSSQAAITNTANADTQIDLSWAKDAQGHNVMIVRSTDVSFTDPTQGTAYSVSDTIGGDTVIYNSSGTSFTDTGRSSSTIYYYKFYSENYDYYSAGVTANETTAAGLTATIANTGTPAAGDITQGDTDVVLFGFSVTPSGGSLDFTALSLDTAGTATTADLSSFEVVYDADDSGTYNGGDSIVSSAAQSLADPISFTITGQTGFSAARRYLVIADVAFAATVGRTFTGNIAAAGDVTTTGAETGTASGNAQTVVACSAPAAPTALYANPTNSTDFTANWTAASGATNYYIDVSTNSEFGGSGGGGTIYSETFETDGQGSRYDSTTEENQGDGDYFGRLTDAGAGVTLAGEEGSYWFGGQDHDGLTDLILIRTNTLRSIDIDGYTSLEMLSIWAEDDDGANQDWDGPDYVHVAYQIDGGSWTELLWFESETTGDNGLPAEDTDRNGVGDGRNLTDTFQEWTNSITGTGTGLVIRIIASMNSGDEDWAVDNIRITGSGGSSTPDYVPGFSNLLVGVGTSQSVTGLTASTTYYYRLRAQNACGTSVDSTTNNVTTVAGVDTTGPVISNFGVTNTSGTIVMDADWSSFPIYVDLADSTSGIDWATAPTWSLTNPASAQAVAPNAFVTTGHTTGETSTTATDTVSGVTFSAGTWTAGIWAQDKGGYGTANSFTFTAVDDDTNPPALGGTSDDYGVYYNLPDNEFLSESTDEFAIRDRLIAHLDLLGNGHTGTMSTFTWSGAGATLGFPEPVLDAVSNALSRGATVRFIIDSDVNTATAFGANSIDSLAARPGNALVVSEDDSAAGIMHHKFSLFDYGPGDRWVFTSSANYTEAGASQQWNAGVDIRNDVLYAAYYDEAVELLAGRFHDDATKSHTHDGTTFSMQGSWSTNWVRFSPPPSGTYGGDNPLRDITNEIAQADTEIYFALNSVTRQDVADQLVALCDANPSMKIHGAIAQDAYTTTDWDNMYSFLTNTANYSGTNMVQFHSVYMDAARTLPDDNTIWDLVHSKWMVIDPFSAEPRAIIGSANWSASGLVTVDSNDENTLFLRHGGIAANLFENWTIMTGAFTSQVQQVASGASMKVYAGSQAATVIGGSDTNLIWSVEYNNLLTNSLTLSFSVYDTESGINRDITTATTNMNITVQSLCTNNVTNYVSAMSSALTTNSSSTSIWQFVNFDAGVVAGMIGTNAVYITVPDGDSDGWTGDTLWRSNHLVGYLCVAPSSTPADPTPFTITATNYTQIDLAFKTNAFGDDIVVVYNTTGTFTAPSGTPPAVGNAFAGGTVLYDGTGSSYSHTGLDVCTHYYYKAFSYTGVPVFSGGLTVDTSTLSPVAPASLWANPTNSTDFTANWSAATGAASYHIDVSTNAEFEGSGGSGGGVIISKVCDPQYGEGSNSFVQIYNTSGSSVDLTGWSVVTVENGSDAETINLSGSIASGDSMAIGDTLSSVVGSLDFTGDYFQGSDSFNGGTDDGAKLYDGVTLMDVAVGLSHNDDAMVRDSTVQDPTTTFASAEWSIVAVTDVSDSGGGAGDVTAYTSDYPGTAPSYVPGFSNLTVAAGTSQVVTGLTQGITYYYRVRTEGGGSCTSDNSTTQNVTTVVITPPTLTSPTATSIGLTGATLGANITAGSGITERGTLWGTSASPTGNGAAEGGTATGVFTDARTGMSQGTKVYYRGYAINGGGTNYSPDGSFYTEPAQATGISFSGVTASGMTVSWTAGTASDGAIVVVRSGDSAVTDPTDGTLHSADAAFGSGADLGSGSYVVYRSTGTTVDITGLSASTTYYVEVFAYKGTVADSGVDQGINYEQSTPLAGNQATGAAAIWIFPRNPGTPMGTYYLGDTMGSWNVNFEIGQASWSTSRVGIGTSAAGAGYDWADANWYEDVATNSPNKLVRRDLTGYQYTETGSHYVICQAVAVAGDTYTSKSGDGWDDEQAYPPSDLAEAYFTCTGLTAPSSPTAITNTANSATRVDLGWTQWNSKNVLITIATAAATGSPTNGDSYSTDDTFGNQTIVSGSQGGTSLTVSGLTPGQSYIFTFYTENYSYYSTGISASSVTLSMPMAQNTSGGSPDAPATIYLGDTDQVFSFDSWGNMDGQWGKARLWLRAANADLTGGTSGSWGAFVDQDNKAVTSGLFNATGTWYWGIQMDYGSYKSNFWYKSSLATWAEMSADGTAASLTVTVSAIVDPSGQTATRDAVNRRTEIDLSWAQNAVGNDVMVVRKLSTDSWTEPTQGTTYAATDAIGSGTVIYNGSNLTASDTGLTEDTTYDYKFYSVNNDYYSAGVTVQQSTAPCEPDAPVTLWANPTNYTDFTANWSSSVEATNYYIDVSTSSTFTSSSGGGGTLQLSESFDSGLAASYTTGDQTLTSGVWGCVSVFQEDAAHSYGGVENAARINDDTAGALLKTPELNTVGAVTFWYRAYSDTGTFIVQKSYDGSAWVGVSTQAFSNTTYLQYSNDFNDSATSIYIRVLNDDQAAHLCVDDFQATTYGSEIPDYVPGYSNLLVGVGTSVSVTGLVSGVEYFYRLRAQGTGGCTGDNSTTQDVTTLTGAPAAPAGLVASDGTSTAHVALSWNNVPTETGFVIWRHTADVPASAAAIYTNAADTLTYNDTGVTAGALYYYWVTATNGTGSSEKSDVDDGYRRLSAPTGVAATDGASTANVTVTWTASTGADSYKIFRDTDSDPTGASDLGTQSSGYADTTVTPGQLYYYWVMAAASASSSTSDWSTANDGYRKLAEVADVIATYKVYNDKVVVSWTDSTGETGYGIWVNTADNSAGASFVGTAAADATNYNDTAATAAVDLYYWVRATNSTSTSQSDFQASGALGYRLDPNLPIVTTDDASEITPTSAKGGGNVTDGGTSAVTERGVCWSTSTLPTTGDSKSAATAGGTGVFTNFISGLTAGETYYIRAYAINGSGTVYGTNKSFQAACFTNGPSGLYANPTNTTDFTANWPAFAGAASYSIDVSTNGEFGGANLMSNAGFETGDSTDWDKFEANYSVVTTDPQEGTYHVTCTATDTRDLTQQVAITGDGTTEYEVSFYYQKPSSTGNFRIYASWSTGGQVSGDDLTPSTYLPVASDWTKVTYNVIPQNGANVLDFEVRTYTGASVDLDNFFVGSGSGGSTVPGFLDLAVAGTSQSVTGLTESTTYYYRIRAEGVGGCTSDNSITASVTTVAAPIIGLDPSSLDFGTVDKDSTSNLTVVVTNSGHADLTISSIVFTGTGNGYFTASPDPLTVSPGTASNVVVTFAPTAGGTYDAVTMTVNNDTAGDTAPTVAIAGICNDPTTEDPSVYDFWAKDSQAITNDVFDHAVANGGMTIGFILYHFEGMAMAGSSYDLLAPDGTVVWTNGTFDDISAVTMDGKACQEYTAVVPGFTPAVLGVYTARVTATSSNAYSVTDEAAFTPTTAGTGVAKKLDNFNRADAIDDIGEGWTANITGPTNGNIQITNQVLQFYGEGGTDGNGRLSVVRDVSARYNPVLANNTGTLTWAFNFYSGQTDMTGLGSGKYGAVFVLGSTSTNLVNGSGDGYGVRICSNEVALVHFSGLNSDGDATTIGTAESLSSTTPIGVRVTLDLSTDTWSLYTTNWGGTGPDDFGNPLLAADLASATVDSTYLGAESLDYIACYWNHGAGTPSSESGAVFDDVHVPYVPPVSSLMNFTVYDEDWTVPVHSGFNVDGASILIDDINPGGLTVTGLVQDANGLYAGTSNVWTLFSNATQVATGSMTMTPNTDGEGSSTAAALSAALAYDDLNAPAFTGFVFRVVSTDYDVDRPGDSLQATNNYTFYVIEEVDIPTNLVANEDGMEMVVLGWDKNGASDVVLLWSTNPITTTSLIPGTAYNINDAGPDDTVVYYHGTNDNIEVIVPQNTSNYFRLFGAAGLTYSAGHSDPTNYPAETLAYESGEIVDQFAYTNNQSLAENSVDTGQGWDGIWFGSTNDWVVEDTNLLYGTTDYPTPYANKIYWHDTNSYFADSAAVTRKLGAARGGTTFIAFMMNYLYDGTNKYSGLSLMSGTDADVEEVFFGKLNDEIKKAGINDPDGSPTVSTYDLVPGHFQDYMIVGELNPAQNTVRMWAYYTNSTIPQEYTNALLDASLIATYSNASLSVNTITGIRLAAGSGDGEIPAYSNELGYVYFDEVRVGGTWDEVLNFNYPKAVGFTAGINIDGTNYISDGELSETGKTYDVSYSLYHRTGVTNAEFTIITNVDNSTGLYLESIPLLLDPTDAEDQYRSFTNTVTNRLDPVDVTLGVYTSRVWMTAVSGKETNTLYMAGMAGADDLFFGEFGEGNDWDKYVEIYNGTGGSIDLSQYIFASQTAPGDKWTVWENWSRLSETPYWLAHGETLVFLNGGLNGEVGATDTVNAALTNAMFVEGRDFLFTSNNVLNISGDDPFALFSISDTNQWIDACGIGPGAARYIMRRLEDAEVPWSYTNQVDTNQWDYRDWESDRTNSPPYTNFIYTAGIYDRNVGMGGFILFSVYDDDDDAPFIGTNSAMMVIDGVVTTSLSQVTGTVEVVLTAWNFKATNNALAAIPWVDSLLTNGLVTCDPAYTPGPVDYADSGTSENDFFGVIEQPNGGVVEQQAIGTYYADQTADTSWIQYEMELTSASEMIFSWAERGTATGWSNAVIQWSDDGVTFSTNALWPSWDPDSGGIYNTRYVEFDGVVTPGISKVWIRIVLGPGFGGAAGYYRMDNVQLNGYPQEYNVTDGEIAASGNKLHFSGNMYDTNSGLDKAQATMELGSNTGTRVSANDTGDGITNTSTMWWELDVPSATITEYVNDSLSGAGLAIHVDIPDLDADRTNDTSWLNGNFGRMRVLDDDSTRPRMTLETMKPLSSIIAQWQCTNTLNFLPTKSDPSVEVASLKTISNADAPKNPYFASVLTNGYYYIEAWAWHGGNKCWVIEMTPEANVAITNLSFTSYQHRTNGVTSYRIEHYVDGALHKILSTNYFELPPGTPVDPTNWYVQTHGFTTNDIVFEAGKVNQIRLYGLGCSNVGARWRILEMTLWQQALSTNGITEVTDEEFTSGSFQMRGNAWDPDSGIASTNNADATKRPMFSLYAPDSSAIFEDELFNFTNAAGVTDGGATNSAEGQFANDLPQANYTNLMLGEYTGTTTLWDYDNDRTVDDLGILGDIALYVVDNDIEPLSTVGVVRVNGVVVPGTAPTRYEVSWSNQPNFLVSFDSVPDDVDPGAGYSAAQRAMTGIGEFRVTATDVSALTPSNRANYGTPYPVAATNGSLANYGFEMTVAGSGWTLDGNCSYQTYANDPTLVKEGTNSLKITSDGTAYQEIEFRNLAAVAPEIAVSGWYQASVQATFRIEAFATNDLVTPVATRNVALGAAASWTAFSIDPAESIGDGTVEILKVSLIDGGGNTTYWDDIRLSVDIGTNLASMNFVAGVANQGLDAQYVFAVDADNNRAGDRLASPSSPFYIAYDVTPPTLVPMPAGGTGASTLTVDDPTTQFDLQWNATNVGPDDEGHANHPTGLSTDRDYLAPWQSYKIYYGTFDPQDVPIGDNPSGPSGYIYTNCIVTGVYTNWASVDSDTTILDPSAAGYQPDYDDITNLTQNTIRLYDLDFDQDYAVVIVGVDKAGNEGPAGQSSWATNNTIRFALTRGVMMDKTEAEAAFPTNVVFNNTNVETAAALYWIAAGPTNAAGQYTSVSKEYDLISWDATSFEERSNNNWQLVGTIQTNWFVDDGGQFCDRGQIRFYRASYKGRWRTTNDLGEVQRPLVSEEVYALHNIILSGGQNYVALHGRPYTNTFEAVFGGTDVFPGGSSALPATGSTLIEFYGAGTNEAPSGDQYWLNTSGRWTREGDSTDVTTNLMGADFFDRGFSISLPDPLPATYVTTTAYDNAQVDSNGAPVAVDAMVWSPIMKVPTNSFSQVISTGESGTRPNPDLLVYNVVALRLPISVHPSQMRLTLCGFTGGIKGVSDEIYTMNTATKGVRSGSTIYCDAIGTWRFVMGDGLIPWDYFKPNDVIVIVSRNGGLGNSWTWTYAPGHFYTLPNRWMEE